MCIRDRDVADLFDLESPNFMYTRLGSPTVKALENKMALLEGGTAGIATSSGQAATLITVLNLCNAGDHVISASNIYGGTHNLLGEMCIRDRRRIWCCWM